jgi:hypothetical protein
MIYPRVISKAAILILFAGIFLQTIPCRVQSQPPSNFVQDDFQHKINLYDVDGRPLVSGSVETKGSPLFLTKWKLGWIRLADGRFFSGMPLILDLQKQVVHYRRSDGNDIEADPGQVKELAILDTVAGVAVGYRFLCGFQPIDNQSQTSYYLLLDSGKLSILESMRKVLRQDKDDFAGETKREYNLYNDFYVVSNGKMVRIKRDSKFFVDLTKDKQPQMDDYLQKNRVSFKSIEDIRHFIQYYNGLP